ncbi:MAG: zinc-ribbon domain-containing protein [Alphaproteobacteria bacterium]
MLISCPKCNAVYQIPDGQIPAEGKKFKCAECGEVWTVRPQDVKKTEPAAVPVTAPVSAPSAAAAKSSAAAEAPAAAPAPQVKSQIVSPQSQADADVEKMFNRLSQDTKGLFSGSSSANTRWDKYKIKMKMFFSPFVVNCSLLLLLFAFTFYIGYANRFYIVSKIPQLEGFYKNMGLYSLYKGRGLIFKSVKTRYMTSRGKINLEVSGLIYNESDMKTAVLPIKAELYNKQGEKLNEVVKVLTIDRLEPSFSAVFRVLIPDSSLEEKNVILSFTENAE